MAKVLQRGHQTHQQQDIGASPASEPMLSALLGFDKAESILLAVREEVVVMCSAEDRAGLIQKGFPVGLAGGRRFGKGAGG